MDIHQIIVNGPFDPTGYPLTTTIASAKPGTEMSSAGEEILTNLTPDSLRRCLDAAAPLLAVSKADFVPQASGRRFFMTPPTEELRLIGMVHYEASTDGIPQIKWVHLLAVGADLETASIPVIEGSGEGDIPPHEGLVHEEELSRLHGDLFEFLGDAPGADVQETTTGPDVFEPLTESKKWVSDDSSEDIDSAHPRNHSGSGDSNDFELSFDPLAGQSPSASSSMNLPVPTDLSSSSSSDILFAPNEADLPAALFSGGVVPDTPVPAPSAPVPYRRGRGAGPRNVVDRAIRQAQERENLGDPLSEIDFEKWKSDSESEMDANARADAAEFDQLMLTDRGIRERSSEEATEPFRPSLGGSGDAADDVTTGGIGKDIAGDAAEKGLATAGVLADVAGTDVPGDARYGDDADDFRSVSDPETHPGVRTSEQPVDDELVVPSHFHRSGRQRNAGDLEWDPTVALRLLLAHNWWDKLKSRISKEDRSKILKQYVKLSDFLGTETPAIADDVFRSFLMCDGGDLRFDDPCDIVPHRWRVMAPSHRRRFFEMALTRFLRTFSEENAGGGKIPSSPTLVIVAEPAMVSLMFYGMSRLLPECPIRQDLSFSTMEVTTCAIGGAGGRFRLLGFWSPDTTRLQEAIQRGLASNEAGNNEAGNTEVLVLDTLAAPPEEKASLYVESQVHRLCEKGWAAVLPRIAGMVPMMPETLMQLETAMLVERTVSTLLNNGQFPNENWRRSPQAMGRFRRELIRRLAAERTPAETMRSVVGGAAHLPTLELLLAKEYPESLKPLVKYLVEQVPPEKMLAVFRRQSVPNEDKIRMLTRHVRNHNGALPPGFEFLWEDWAGYATEKTPTPTAMIVARILRRLEPDEIGVFMRACPSGRLPGFVDGVITLYRQNRLHRGSVAAMWMAMDELTLARTLRQKGMDFIRTYPKEERGFGRRLEKLILTFPQYPEEFEERFQWLLAGQHHLEEDYQAAVENWSTFVAQVQKVAKLQKVDASQNQDARIRMLVAATHELARSADQAMDFPEITQDFLWTNKRDVMYRMASHLLGGRPLFEKGPWEHVELMQWIDIQFRDHRWPKEVFRKGSLVPEKKKVVVVADGVRAPNNLWVTISIVLFVLTVCGMCLLGLMTWLQRLTEEP